MSKIAYERRSFTPAGLEVVRTAAQICADYAAQGYTLGLRGLYYQFIARNLFPDSRAFELPNGEFTKNVTKNYKWLISLVTDGRVSGIIDWDHIMDEGRDVSLRDRGWDSPEDILRAIAEQYKIPRWEGQPEHVEVWVEKAALGQIIRQAADAWDVTSFECKGSPSTSTIHDAAKRLRSYEARGIKCTIIYLGDHDPTGLDIDRDVRDRLRLFRCVTEVTRIALTMDQVNALNPPPSPVKVTDSRTNGYIDTYGTDECWELDAIDPPTLDGLIQDAIREHVDMDLRQARLDREAGERAQLEAVHENWIDVLAWMQDENMVREPEPAEDGDDSENEED
jgi:hypothetical protein